MKQIKAYIRHDQLHDVETNLERAGFTCITLVEATAAGSLVDPEKACYSSQFVKSSEVAKVELVCSDERVDEAVRIIEKHGRVAARETELSSCPPSTVRLIFEQQRRRAISESDTELHKMEWTIVTREGKS